MVVAAATAADIAIFCYMHSMLITGCYLRFCDDQLTYWWSNDVHYCLFTGGSSYWNFL